MKFLCYTLWHEINIHQFTKRVWSPKRNAIFVTLWMLKIHQKVHLFVFHIDAICNYCRVTMEMIYFFQHIFPLAAYVHICFVINFQYQKYFLVHFNVIFNNPMRIADRRIFYINSSCIPNIENYFLQVIREYFLHIS